MRPETAPALGVRSAPRLYASQHGPIPVCPWLLPRWDCEIFEDLNRDGRADLEDLHEYCRVFTDGDTLTTDVVEPYSSRSCYTCD